MCGIAGFVGAGNRQILEKMVESIKYRGPDDRGFLVKNNVGLGHARLSIIDLSFAGRQPMSNYQETVWLVFNGEIYNFKELRIELLKTGKYTFKSQTDTEALIYLYEEYGISFLKKLNGMFAIALYDFKIGKLILARDRIGKKPLYWGLFNSTLIFGSELKAILEHPITKKEIDFNSFNQYLTFEYVPTPHSILKSIYKLEPATSLVFQGGKIKKEKFWKLDFNEKPVSFNEALSTVDSLLNQAVKSRLMADVPIGIFLSGGLDSSTIAYYAQKNSSKKIKTFSVGFEEKSFDESAYAKIISNFLGTEHHCSLFTSKEILDTIPYIISLLDEPLADVSLLPTFFLSHYAKRYVTVALGGDGGDELFAGYPTFQAENVVEIYKKLPHYLRKKIIEKIINLLPIRDSNFSFDFKLKKFVSGVYSDQNRRHFNWLGSFNKSELDQLLSSEIRQEIKNKNEYSSVDQYYYEAKEASFNNKLLYLYLRTYLMDDVLVKVDRASMYNALEVRAPFLDFNLVEFLAKLSYNYKYRHFQTKYILKKLMIDKLPKNIVFRQKKGFGIPLAKWLKADLKELCEDLLSKNNIEKDGFLNFEYITKLKQDHYSGMRDNHKQIWTLMVWQMWKKNWL
ncbi:MAG: asparagine synthase (glutamine-hydrolyzing) [Patescibacteria group bacterium]|nr:asparagine synthase (glutamine-hydrolyzing) [Patescibacteria group bacterium]